MVVVLHRTPTESDGAEENRAGSRNVFFMRVLMSVAAAAGSWAMASREFQRGCGGYVCFGGESDGDRDRGKKEEEEEKAGKYHW